MIELHEARDGAIEEAARRVLAGRLVAFPTETFYGLAVDPRRTDAVERLFATKGREPGRALPLVAGERGQIALVAPDWESFARAVRLAAVFWPGPLSLILPGTDGVAPYVRAPDGTVAVRWSPHPVAAALAREIGFPVVATSANRSGSRPCRYATEVVEALQPVNDLFVLDGGATTGGLPSSVVDIRGAGLKIVRAGAVDERAVREALGLS
jgi:L-threonylcarbamoyladenylate synthase